MDTETVEALMHKIDMQIWAAVIGVIGAALAAACAWMAQVRASKWALLLDLYREFNTEAMSTSRTKAWEFVRKNWRKTYSEIAYNEALDQEALHLWNVMRFYHRLAIVTKHNQVVRARVPDLFGEIFLWWYRISFERMFAPSERQLVWEAWLDINWLYKWISLRGRGPFWDDWEKQAAEDIKKHGLYVSEESSTPQAASSKTDSNAVH